MLHFAAPLGLIAASAVLVPVALHLVRRPRQVVRLGSLRFLDASPRRVNSLRWRDHLLLALRCALLAALAVLLAVPLWRPKAPQPARWVLLSPQAELTPQLRGEIQRLRAGGYELRALAAGFPPLADESSPAPPGASDVWSLLRELDFRLPADSHVIAAAPLHADAFVGSRPTLTRVRVSWLPAARVTVVVPVPAATKVALIAAANRADDALYLRAALTAIDGVRITDDAPHWIIQLGDAPLGALLQQRVRDGATLVADAPDTAAVTATNRSFDAAGATVRVRQRAAPPEGASLIVDSAGETLLAEKPVGRGRRWGFALRFHPDWTDWPHTSALPAWWQAHLTRPSGAAPPLALEQAAPGFAPAAAESQPPLPGFNDLDLRPFCWTVAVALFLAERGLAATARRKAIT